ncbi:hypothetical protein PM023_13195 [Halorubrum ezzemoulense]|uniref:hypothetical protein n=1 Tax=Halorubrum ezzemoulense TaxID=337243 RepID=UPI00232EA230|nr:hypothetical protein [Halorubrum ezzemoulense]MDB2225626.1 hypothetical protein [Halorubrum ezzemoulense]
MTNIPAGLLETAITLIAGALFTLVGIIYRRLKKRIAELEENIAQLESQLLTLKRDMDTAQSWMFGLDDDETNHGIASQISSINQRLTQLIDALHDEDDLEFERDDADD